MAAPSPTLAGFTDFCRTVAGITPTIMPDADPGFQRAFDISLEMVPQELCAISAVIYTDCVYCWGVSVILQFQQDQAGQTFFADMRSAYGTNNLVPGVISADADEATSTSLTVGKSLSNLSLTDLQRIKDPFGRQAIAYLMDLGPVWGLT